MKTLRQFMEDYKKSLPPGVRKDMEKGGKTASPMGDLAIMGATALAKPIAQAALAGSRAYGALKNLKKRTLKAVGRKGGVASDAMDVSDD